MIPSAVTTTSPKSEDAVAKETETLLCEPETETSLVAKPRDETSNVTLPDGALMLNVPSDLVEVAVLLPLILTVAEATALLSGPVTVPETCRVCANVADIMHSTEQKIKSKLFIRFCLVCLIMN